MTTGIWIDKPGHRLRRWLCKCGDQRPGDMPRCYQCDLDRPAADAPDIWEIRWMWEDLHK